MGPFDVLATGQKPVTWHAKVGPVTTDRSHLGVLIGRDQREVLARGALRAGCASNLALAFSRCSGVRIAMMRSC